MAHDQNDPLPGGELEHTLLVTLWEGASGGQTARQLHNDVGARRGIVYTTVAKVLDRMVAKGLVKRHRSGRAFVYNPRVGRERTQRSIFGGVLRNVLGASPRPAVAALVGALQDVSPELLDELAAELERCRDERRPEDRHKNQPEEQPDGA